MSEYRNDPPIDFMLDKDSKDYANRYNQHIHAMTAERLNSKSDIAWELTIRDQRIAELEAQNKQMLESILIEVEYYPPNGEYMRETEAFYCDGVVYGLEKAAAIVKAALKERLDEHPSDIQR